MTVIFIDNVPYAVKEGQNLLQACLGLGFDVPYFCWHPALGSVGACRQCAVKQFKDEHDDRGKIVLACMTPAAEGVRISINDPEALAFRAAVIEWMMINHPHDCPVCDEGGECHLQDMTVLTGHVRRAYPFPKRTFRNQDLGPLIHHEMNRCIHCYRCVRFYREYAGGRDFGAFGSRNRVYFGRAQDGALESEFSGNLVEVCPTGVFTDKTFRRHVSRKWDLQTAPSVCVHCGLGCNTIAGARYGELRRIRNRYNGEVNGYFLCDRGRFGYEFVRGSSRIRRPLLRRNRSSAAEEIDSGAALLKAAEFLGDRSRVIGIGSPRASLESNYALRRLVGPDRFFLGVSAEEYRALEAAVRILRKGSAPAASLKDTHAADAALVLGEDVTNCAPILALALRRMVRPSVVHSVQALHIPPWHDSAVRELARGEKDPLYLATPGVTKLEDIARRTYHAAPEDLARLGFAVAHRIDSAAPDVPGLPEETACLAEEIAACLLGALKPLIVSGSGCGSVALMQAAANVAWALRNKGRGAALSFILPEADSLGLGLLGGGELESALQALRKEKADTVVVLENDLYRRTDSETVNAALRTAKHVIVIDHIRHATAEQADLILPAAAFAEDSGTLIGNEGRAQRFFQAVLPADGVQGSWCWLGKMDAAASRSLGNGWSTLDELLNVISTELPLFEPARKAAPPAEFRLGGQKIPRQSPRFSGRTAIHAEEDVSEPKPPEDENSALAFSMEGAEGHPPPELITRYWAPGWDSVQALNKFQAEIGGPLAGGDPGARLLEPAAGTRPDYFDSIPPTGEAREGSLRLVRLYHIFGSEPLSMLSPAIAELAPRPYAALDPGSAAALGVMEGDVVRVEGDGISLDLPARILLSLPQGTAGLPAGLPGMPHIPQPAWCSVEKRPHTGSGGENPSPEGPGGPPSKESGRE
jgi:NADH-quinone oxidoreductase subunit G